VAFKTWIGSEVDKISG